MFALSCYHLVPSSIWWCWASYKTKAISFYRPMKKYFKIAKRHWWAGNFRQGSMLFGDAALERKLAVTWKCNQTKGHSSGTWLLQERLARLELIGEECMCLVSPSCSQTNARLLRSPWSKLTFFRRYYAVSGVVWIFILAFVSMLSWGGFGQMVLLRFWVQIFWVTLRLEQQRCLLRCLCLCVKVRKADWKRSGKEQ